MRTAGVTPRVTPSLLAYPIHPQYARGLAQRFPLVTGLQGDSVTRVVVGLRPGVHCAVQWRMSHLLCPMGISVGSIAQVGSVWFGERQLWCRADGQATLLSVWQLALAAQCGQLLQGSVHC